MFTTRGSFNSSTCNIFYHILPIRSKKISVINTFKSKLFRCNNSSFLHEIKCHTIQILCLLCNLHNKIRIWLVMIYIIEFSNLLKTPTKFSHLLLFTQSFQHYQHFLCKHNLKNIQKCVNTISLLVTKFQNSQNPLDSVFYKFS